MQEVNPQQSMYPSGFSIEGLMASTRKPRSPEDEVDIPTKTFLDQLRSIQGYFPAPEAPNLMDLEADARRLEPGKTVHFALYALASRLQPWPVALEGRIADHLANACADATTKLDEEEEKLGAINSPEQAVAAYLPHQLVPRRELFFGMVGSECANARYAEVDATYNECWAAKEALYRSDLHKYVEGAKDRLEGVRQELCKDIPDNCSTVRRNIAADTLEEVARHMKNVRNVTLQAIIQGRGDDPEAVRFLKQTTEVVANLLEASKTNPDIRRQLGELLIRDSVLPSAHDLYGKARELFRRHMVDGLHDMLVAKAGRLSAGHEHTDVMPRIAQKLPVSSSNYLPEAVAHVQKTLDQLAQDATTTEELYDKAVKVLHPDQTGIGDTFTYLRVLRQEESLKGYIDRATAAKSTEADTTQKTAQQ